MYGVECRRQYKREERIVDSIYLHTTKPGVFIPPVARLSTFPSSPLFLPGQGADPGRPMIPQLRHSETTTPQPARRIRVNVVSSY
jgi:hypothetical protein